MHVADFLIENFNQYVQPWIDSVCSARDWLRSEVTKELGLRAYGRFANHVLIDLRNKETAGKVGDALKNLHGFYTKYDCPTPFDRYMLVTCASLPAMSVFYDRFAKIFLSLYKN